MRDEFGAGYARSVASDQALTDLGGRTTDEALAAGVAPARVWQALCAAMDIPPGRRLGADPELPPAGSRATPGPASGTGRHQRKRGRPHGG